jgi:repressor of nif and glnA expression
MIDEIRKKINEIGITNFPIEFLEWFNENYISVECKCIRKKDKHTLAMEIVNLLIDSGLSISDQLKVINKVKEKLEFCKKTGAEMQQLKLDLI